MRRDLIGLAVVAALGALAPAIAARYATTALVKFGPNDLDYVRGFRPDWERDGRTRFRWTSPAASVALPIFARGDGFVLRARIRRHFIEPAHVRLITEGQAFSTFDLKADEKVAYRTIEVPLPRLVGRQAFSVSIEAGSENPRPLGLALDWMEIGRNGGSGEFVAGRRLQLLALLLAAVAFVAPRLAGLGFWPALANAVGFVVTIAFGVWGDLIAAERVLRLGAATFIGVGLIGLLVARVGWFRDLLRIDSAAVAGGLVLVAQWALAARLVLLLHPQFYYPDVKVHSLFAWQLARQGLARFLQDFTANQYRFSLGLQFENGHWYAFPYPPGFYILCWPLVSLAGYRPEVAVSLAAAAVNALEGFLVFSLARRLGFSSRIGLAAASASALLPLFLARLSLAYFPALVGHFVDLVAILYLLAQLEHLARRSVVIILGGLLAFSTLVYTQSVLNFVLLILVFLPVQALLARGPEARSRQLGLATAAVLGAALSLGAFYGRYVPVFLDMRQGVPMAEERILLDKAEHARPSTDEPAVDEPDPYTGPTLDLARGLAKASWRLYVFYGLFVAPLCFGVALVLRQSSGDLRRFLAVWLATYVLLNLASGGLPGPNLVRYNKDLELIAPLCCLALAAVGGWLWDRARPIAVAYALGFMAFGLSRGATYLVEKWVLER